MDKDTQGMPDLTPAPTTITNPIINRPPPPLLPRPCLHNTSTFSSDAHYSQPTTGEPSAQSCTMPTSGPIHTHNNSIVNPVGPMEQQHGLVNTSVRSCNTDSLTASNVLQSAVGGTGTFSPYATPAILPAGNVPIPPMMTRMAPVIHTPVPHNPRVSVLPAHPIHATSTSEKKPVVFNYMQPLSQIQPRAPSIQVPPPAHSPVSIESMSLVATGQAVDMTKRTSSPRSANTDQEEKGMDLSKHIKDYVAPASVPAIRNLSTAIQPEGIKEPDSVVEHFTEALSIETNPHEGIRYTDEISPNSRLDFVPTVDEASLPPLNYTPEESPGNELSEMDRRVRDKAKRIKKQENESDTVTNESLVVKPDLGEHGEEPEIFTQTTDTAPTPAVKTSVRFTEGQYETNITLNAFCEFSISQLWGGG